MQSTLLSRDGRARIVLMSPLLNKGQELKCLGLLPEGFPNCKLTSSMKMQEVTGDQMQFSDSEL